MSPHERDSHRWLDQELREVPLPEGLIARLKEICAGDDDLLDAAICDVHIPEGLLAKLKSVPADRKLDKALRKIVVPDDLSARLKAIPDEATTTSASATTTWDTDFGQIDQPESLARQRWYQSPLALGAMAASLCAVIAVIGLGMLGDSPRVADQTGPPAGIQPSDGASPTAAELSDRTASQEDATDESVGGPPSMLADQGDASEPGLAEQDTPTPTPDALVEDSTTPVDRGADSTNSDVPPADRELSATLPEGPGIGRILVTDDRDERVPELQRVVGLVPRGVAPPPVKEYPRMRLLRDGVHPFVSPAQHARLRESHVPLVTRATSYHIARRDLRSGRLPLSEEIRTEGFLAGVDYQFPQPTTEALGIRTAAGPSPFGAEGTQLLQVAVQAGGGSPRKEQGTALTLAVDVSASMEHGDRLMMVRRALADLAHQLGPRDRLSLIGFSQRADVLITDAGRDRVEGIVAAIEELTSGDVTNLAAGLRAATTVALGTPLEAGISGRLVLLTDRVGYLSESVVDPLEDLAAETAAAGVRLDVIDVGYEVLGDPRLHDLARSGGGQMKVAHEVEDVRYALTEILTGRSPTVARGARLTVRFNPKVVAEYRLLGHEADMVGGLLPGNLEASFNVGETATVLFELRLLPAGGAEVAQADLRWQDEQTGQKSTHMQRISRLQFATSVIESPLPLQMAAIVAEAAEVLRGSVYAPTQTAALAHVLDVADNLHPLVFENQSFVEFLTTIEQAHRLRTAKSSTFSGPRNRMWQLPR